jgi:hypothetical protein
MAHLRQAARENSNQGANGSISDEEEEEEEEDSPDQSDDMADSTITTFGDFREALLANVDSNREELEEAEEPLAASQASSQVLPRNDVGLTRAEAGVETDIEFKTDDHA